MISRLVTFWENLKIALRALAENKMRSVLTTIGIIIGVLTVVSVASIIEGLNKGFASQISALGSNTVYVQKYPWMSGEDWFKYRNRPDIRIKDVEYVMDHLETDAYITPEVSTRRNVKYKDNQLEDINVNAATVPSLIINGLTIEEGRNFTTFEIERKQNKVIIGYEVKNRLFKDISPLGRRIRIGNTSFLVVGVLEKRGSFLGMSMDNEVYIPFGALLKNYGSRRSLSIVVKVRNPAEIEKAVDELQFLMRISRKLRPGEQNDFSINQQEVLMDTYNKLTGSLYTAAIGIGFLSLLVGGIGIMNIMLVSVAERRREIGIRKALGATKRVISLQFIIESIVICTIGGSIAILLSFLVSIGIDKATPFPASVPGWSIGAGLLFSSFVGIFFGIYPASRAAKMEPIECLHYE